MLKLFTPSDREAISLEDFVVKERIEEGLLDMCKSQGVPYRAPAFMESSDEFRQRRKGMLDALDMPEKKRGGMTNGTPNSKRLPQVPTVTPESGSSFARSIIEREQEEVELAVMCKLLEIAYIPPAERETKEQTLERRELLRGWCREYENKKKPAVAASRKKKSLHPTVPPFAAMPAGGQNGSNQSTKRKATEAPEAKAPSPKKMTTYSRQSSGQRDFVYDAKLAATLQRQETRLAEEEQQMLSDHAGRAFKFVEKVSTVCFSLTKEHGDKGIEPVAQDQMVPMTENMLECQETFKQAKKNTKVDVGFHFTSESGLEHIQRDGLMTMEDRESNPKLNPQEAGRKHGLAFGDGVYTGNVPAVIKRYGNVGMLVIRLQGKTKRISPNDVELTGTLAKPGCRVKPSVAVGQKAIHEGYDTVIGNKQWSTTPNRERYDEIVLLQSCQVVPVLKFNATLVRDKSTAIPGAFLPWVNAMKKIVDDFFNKPETLQGSNVDDVCAPSTSAAQKPPPSDSAVPRMSFYAARKLPLPNSAVTRKPFSNSGAAIKPLPPNSRTPSLPLAAAATTITKQQGQKSPPAGTQAKINSGWRNDVAHTTGLSRFSNQAIPSSLGRFNLTTSLSEAVIRYNAPHTLPSSDTSMLETPKEGTFNSNDQCVMCIDPLGHDATKLSKSKKCNHVFHKQCLLKELRHRSKCPVCQMGIEVPIGTSPSGEMRVSTNKNMSCEGFSSVGTIVIDYKMFSGVQKEYHNETGRSFEGVNRRAFLPDNEDGRNLLKRLNWAFSHGLIFRIGTSATTGQSGVITWSSVHHKTKRTKGAYGWPDSSYFTRCNKELDNLGVPKAANCS